MSDPLQILRLLLALLAVMMLVPGTIRWYAAEQRGGRVPLLVVTAIGALPLAAWLIAPSVFSVGAIVLELIIRRLGLLPAAAAVVLNYLRARALAVESDDPWSQFARFSGVLFGAGALLISANWLVGAATLLAGILYALKLPAGWSSPQDQ